MEDIKSVIEYSIFSTNWIVLVLAVSAVVSSLILRRIFVGAMARLMEKATGSQGSNLNTYVIQAVKAPARFLIVVMGIWVAVLIIDFPEKPQQLLDRIITSLVALSVFRAAYRASDILTLLMEKILYGRDTKLDEMLLLFIRKSLKVLIIVFGTITIVQEWYDNIGGLLAGLGLGGLALALAAKDTVANLFGSITIMMDRPFKIGDWIATPQAEGIVEEIGFRSTRVRMFSQAVVTIPNSTMSNDSITNWSRMGKRRISFRLGLKYGTAPEKISGFLEYLRDMLREHPDVHPDTVVVCFEKFGESALEIYLYFFTTATDWQRYLQVREGINFSILNRMEEMGLEMAFPSRDIYIERNCQK